MPVSFLPLVIPALLIGIPFLFLLKGQKPFIIASAHSASVLMLFFLSIYLPGWLLRFEADRGNAAAMYELARWTENHDERIGEFILWLVEPDVLGGYAWLEKAASLDYPPALYALGTRIKYGYFVPRPADWKGPEGNVYPQPERGQILIDRAVYLGYKPMIGEEQFYMLKYREW